MRAKRLILKKSFLKETIIKIQCPQPKADPPPAEKNNQYPNFNPDEILGQVVKEYENII